MFRPSRIIQLTGYFKDKKYIVISLVVNNNDVLRQRVMDNERDSGFRDIEKAIKWNDELKNSEILPNEHRIDSTRKNIEEITQEIVELLQKKEKI